MSRHDDNTIRVPLGKPRNPFGDDYDGPRNAGKHEPPKQKYRPNYEAILEEEEEILELDPLEENSPEDEAEANWREYLASQNVAAQTGKVTPK